MAGSSEVVDVLCDLIALPSVNPEGDVTRSDATYGESRVAEYVSEYFRSYPVTVERLAVSHGRDNVLVHIGNHSSETTPLLLEAHMDTVDPGGMSDPFVPRVEQGRVYGRGACDTKGSLAAMMVAVKSMLEQGVEPARRVVLAATVDEEYAMTGARHLLTLGRRFWGAVVGEPTGLHIVTAHDGQIYCRVVVHGQAAHTSNPWDGLNAIYLMNEVVSTIRKRSEVEYPRRQHPLCGAPLLTVSVIRGGTSEHIVPDRCEVLIDFRVIPGESCLQVLGELKGWLREELDPDTLSHVEVMAPHKMETPLETPVEHPFVQQVYSAARAVVGSVQMAGVRYNTNASHYGPGGIPCVVFGPGSIRQAHSALEYVEINELESAVGILRYLVESGARAQ